MHRRRILLTLHFLLISNKFCRGGEPPEKGGQSHIPNRARWPSWAMARIEWYARPAKKSPQKG
jgi:hypothetical protein